MGRAGECGLSDSVCVVVVVPIEADFVGVVSGSVGAGVGVGVSLDIVFCMLYYLHLQYRVHIITRWGRDVFRCTRDTRPISIQTNNLVLCTKEAEYEEGRGF